MTSPRLDRWFIQDGFERRRGHTDVALPGTPEPPEYVPQFLGDPGENEYMLGWAFGPYNDNLTEVRANAGYPGDAFISVIHDYSSNGQGIDTTSANAIIAAGFIPSQSLKFKSAGTGPQAAASIASGARDGWIDTMAAYCISKEPNFFYLCFFHEPGSNFGLSANTQAQKDFRDATRRIVLRMRVAGVTNVVWQCILETPWNFAGNGVSGAPVSGSPSWMDFRFWHADWDWRNNTWFDELTMDVFGVDQYVPMIGGAAYRQFSTDIGYIKTKLAATGAPDWPIFVLEHGMNNDAVGHNWTDYATKKAAYMKANNIKLSTYWDNSRYPEFHQYEFERNGRYSFDQPRPVSPQPGWHGYATGFDVDGTKKAGYAILRDGAVKVAN